MIYATLQRRWPALALLASALMLGAAHAFEAIGGYLPCELCLRQREIYWVAGGLAAIGLIVTAVWRRDSALRIADFVLGLVFLTGAVVAAYHAGVEWRFGPGPPTCAGAGAGALDAGSILDALSQKNRIVPCEEAAWRMADISMAGYNALISLALAGASFLAAAAPPPRQGGDEHG